MAFGLVTPEGAGYSTANGIAADAGGDSYVAGFFSNTDFDPGPGTAIPSTEGNHLFVARYDMSGSLVWVTATEGATTASPRAMGWRWAPRGHPRRRPFRGHGRLRRRPGHDRSDQHRARHVRRPVRCRRQPSMANGVGAVDRRGRRGRRCRRCRRQHPGGRTLRRHRGFRRRARIGHLYRDRDRCLPGEVRCRRQPDLGRDGPRHEPWVHPRRGGRHGGQYPRGGQFRRNRGFRSRPRNSAACGHRGRLLRGQVRSVRQPALGAFAGPIQCGRVCQRRRHRRVGNAYVTGFFESGDTGATVDFDPGAGTVASLARSTNSSWRSTTPTATSSGSRA